MGAEFPRELGNSLITNIEKVAQHTKAMTPDQLDSYGMVEYEKLQRVYGDKLEEKLNQAGRMVEELEKSSRGSRICYGREASGDNALVVAQIIGQSERYWTRRR